jgi:dTDP-4-amino-4,6-dideoxygalactose transaminase
VTNLPPIPLVDLRAQQRDVAELVEAGFADVLENCSFIGGPAVGDFEQRFAEYCGTAHCVGVANGTDAIEIALRALGIGRGDEVIIPANTFIATAEAVDRAGADVVLVDCVDDTLLIDPANVGDRITDATRAVIGVDLYGQIAPFDALSDALGTRDIELVEDAAQSQGATRGGCGVGAAVSAAATSFYPGKNLGAYGDAGAIVTNDSALESKARAIGGHGGIRRYEHEVIGFNSRLDTLQAVVLTAKLQRLNKWNAQRRVAADRYHEMLVDDERVVRLTTAEGNLHVWHLYVVRVPERDRVLAELQAQNIGAGIHYPHPVHLTGAFAHLGHARGDFPVAEAAADSLLTLPLFPHITEEQQVRVVSALQSALG